MLGSSVDDQAWKQAGLNPSQGGLGLRHSVDVAVPAFLGSVAETHTMVLALLGEESLVIPGASSAASKFRSENGSIVPMDLGMVNGHLERQTVTKEVAQEFPRHLQSKYQDVVDTRASEELRTMAVANSKDRLDATRRKHAGAWASAFPSKALGLWMPSREFALSARCWLGMLSQQEAKALLRPGLGMHGRHHGIQECLISLCRSAGVAARKEVLIDSSNSRPADVFLPHWSRGVSYAVDVTVSHPSQGITTMRDGEMPTDSASVSAAKAKVAQKTAKYKTQCDAQGVAFVAAAVCCFGGWLPDMEKMINELADRSALRSGFAASVIKAQFWQRLGVALWRGNASQLLHYTG